MSVASDPKKLVEEIRKKSPRAIARAISIIEDRKKGGEKLIELLFPYTGGTHIIGVTGSPGAGKSTLVDQLAWHISKLGKSVSILAIDPSSPFTGGALLGDRIRMSHASTIPGVFIRSMASRGALGGIAPTTAEAIYVLEAASYDFVIIETVGVGQGEVEIVRTCDSCIVVLVPGMGDEIQALKAGILEIADVFAINKADREGIERLKKELVTLLSLSPKTAKKPAVVPTVATTGQGISELYEEVARYNEWAKKEGALAKRKESFLQEALYRQISGDLLSGLIDDAKNKGTLSAALQELISRKKDPLTISRELITAWKTGASKT